MSKQEILALLKQSGSEYLSGETMSCALGISRAAVWKAVDSLRQDGYRIDSVTNRGYRLTASPDRLTAGEIIPHLRGAVVGRKLVCLDTVDSTNNYAKMLALSGGADGTVVVANHQSGGRGRMGRSFQSPENMGVYLTALLRPQSPALQAVSLTAFVAVAVCDGVEAACGVRPSIKWTNDVVLQGRKLCGILTEMELEGESGALRYVVTGIGVNCAQREKDFAPEVRPVAVSLAQALGRPVDRGRVAAEIVNALDEMYAGWQTRREAYLERYRQDCVTVGKEVRLIRPDGERTAFAEAVDDDFGLVVRYPDGSRETVTSGEVSVRGLCGYV